MTIQQSKNKVLNLARGEIGTHEGANNWNKYAADDLDKFFGWHIQNQPYCDIFFKWLFIKSFGGEKTAKMIYEPIGGFSALCSASANYYKKNGAWFTTPQIGDQIFFYYSGDINHTGIVENISGNIITTIEGNSSDMIARRTYNINNNNNVIAGYGRPNWAVVAISEQNTDTDKDDDNNIIPTPTPTPITNKTIYPLLKRNSPKKIAVRALQLLLIKQGYDCGGWGVDGDFGFGTYQSVKEMQRNANLTVDGECGDYSWCYIITGNKNGENPPILKKGCSISKSVKSAQQLLIYLGYNCGGYGDDGEFGNGTEKSVKEYKQKAMGIKNPSGEIDLDMWKSLIGG